MTRRTRGGNLPAASPPVDDDDLEAVLHAVLRQGGRWGEVYVERRISQTLRLVDSAVVEIRSDLDLGAGVRVITAGRTGYVFTNVVERSALLEACSAAVHASGAGPQSVASSRTDLRNRRVTPVQHAQKPAAYVPAGDKVTLLRRVCDGAFVGGSEVVAVDAVHVDVTQSVLIATTEGNKVCDERSRTRVTCRVTARRGSRTETGFEGPGTGGGLELYDEHTPESIGVRAAERALRALDGVPPPTGRLPVVLGPSGGGLLLHEACGHGLEGDVLVRGSSVYAKTIGKPVASSAVSAVDDPSFPNGFGSYAVDDEGADATPTELLTQGIQTGALSDRTNTVPGTAAVSANGRRASYTHPPLARMSNTYILPGSSSAEDLLGSVARGVYVTRLRGGDVDVTSGDFAFSAAEAFLVEKGAVGEPLLALTLLGNGPQALASIEVVADDLSFTQALCGKGDQWLPVSYGSPSLLISGLEVAGGADD